MLSMKKATDWFVSRRGYEYFAAPIIALIVLYAAFAGRGIWPFGGLSVAIWDMDIQYVGLFGWLSNVMHGQGSLAYSFSAGMGEGMASTFAYYLASPFNLLAWFFDAERAPQLMSVLTLAKLSAAALTCYSFLRKRHRPGAIHVILAVAYALCGWGVAQCSNIMWLDGLIMLPLVALGTWRVVARGTCLTLFLSVAGAVLFNWYSGYMDCLFSVFYFFVCWLAQPRGQIRVRQGLRYGATMVLGLGASLVIFLPAILGLLNSPEGSGSLLESLLDVNVSCNPLKVLAGFAVGATPASDWDVTPALYSGELAVVLTGAYLLNRRVDVRERALYGGLLALMLVTLLFWPLDTLWSCLKHATSYYFRYSFVVSFVVVMLAARGWESLDGVRGRDRLRVCAVSAAVSCLLIGAGSAMYRVYKGTWLGSAELTALTEALLAAYAALVWLAGEEKRTRARAALVCACAFSAAELGVNAWSVFGHYTRGVDEWGAYVSRMRTAYDGIERDGEWADLRVALNGFSFRAEGVGNVTTTEGLLMGASGMEEYTSTMNGSFAGMLSKLGYCGSNEVFGYYYNAPMTLTDALLGVDYSIASEQPPASSAASDGAGAELPYAGYSLWKSDVAMPAAYGIRSGAGQISWPSNVDDFDNSGDVFDKVLSEQWSGSSPSKDPFANQAAMLADMTGELADGVYREAEVAEAGEGAGSADSRSFTVTATSDGPLYLYVPIIATLRLPCGVSIDGVWTSAVGGNFDNNIIYLGEFAAGQSVTVTLSATQGKTYADAVRVLGNSSVSDMVVAKTLDLDEMQRLLGLLDSNAAQVETYEDGHVRLSFSADEDETLCTVIPYDSGWTVTVDGEKDEVRALYDGLCGVDLTAGEHVVEFTYETPGFAAGCAATVASIAVFSAWRAVARRRAR